MSNADDNQQEKKTMTKLVEIEGIGETYAAKLQDAGVSSLENLLEKGATKKGRKELEGSSGISGKLILRWINMADLFRIKGIGEQYSDLLEAAGVDTVPELAQRKPENLHAKMVEVNEEKNLVRALPSLSTVESWVVSAKELPRVVTY
jgi:predicted flap endonuclease-1-like 5' DNA nuclease